MIGIIPKNPKISFGAADAAPITQPIVPAPVDDPPLQTKLGYLEHDLYGEGNTSRRRHDMTLAPEFRQYSTEKEHKKHNIAGIVKTIATIAVLGTIAILGIKHRAKIKDFFKNLFKKAPKEEEEVKGVRPPKIVDLAEFQNQMKDVSAKAKTGKYSEIPQKSFRVLYGGGEKTAEKAASLQQVYELATIYSKKDRQARVLILMPESLSEHAEGITTMFAKGKIQEVKKELLAQIEGFQIVNADRRNLNESHDIIVDSQVRHGVNAGKASDVGGKWWRNLKRAVKEMF